MTQTPPPGWHPDPEGVPNQLRWWDGQRWTSATHPASMQTSAAPKAAPPVSDESQEAGVASLTRKPPRKALLAALAGLVVIVIAASVVAITGSNSGDHESVSAAKTSGTPTPTTLARATQSPEEAAASRSSAAAQVESSRVRASAAAESSRAAAAAKLDPNTYETVTARDFALIAKNPDSFKGRKVVLYGVVTQADSITGPKMFRARTAAEPMGAKYNYDQNMIVTALDPSIIADVVEDDFVTMHVEILGSQSYDTQIGGNTTAPKVQVNIINVTG